MIAAFLLALASAFLPACPDDGPQDSACYWSAVDHGNGEGRSYIDLGNGSTLYL